MRDDRWPDDWGAVMERMVDLGRADAEADIEARCRHLEAEIDVLRVLISTATGEDS